MDLVIYAPDVAGPIFVDLTVVSALSRAALRSSSAGRDGAAAAVAARRKVAGYPQCTVTPFVVEDHGRFGEDALRLARLLAPKETKQRSSALRQLYQAPWGTNMPEDSKQPFLGE